MPTLHQPHRAGGHKRYYSKWLLQQTLFGVIFVVAFGFAGAAAVSAQTFQSQDPLEQEIKLTEPKLNIRIPTVDFTPPKKLTGQIEETENGQVLVHVPFLAEYIRDVYKYAVAIAAVLSIVMLILAGFQWVLSGGNPEGVNTAKKRIGNALIGLLLAVGSYTILYTINPSLVKFRSLQIFYIQKPELVLGETGQINYDVEASADRPSWTADNFDCSQTHPPTGVISESQLEAYECPGIFGTIRTVPEMKESLCKVGQILIEQGYTATVAETYRSFERQVQYWCDRGGKGGGAAVPGYSRHGKGMAVDIHLSDNRGTRLYTLGSGKQSLRNQCKINPDYIKILADAFYKADSKFNRLESEIWHFEYGTTGQSIGKYTTLPNSCSGS